MQAEISKVILQLRKERIIRVLKFAEILAYAFHPLVDFIKIGLTILFSSRYLQIDVKMFLNLIIF